MKKLALIGKNIQHSLSPSIYKRIFGEDITYDLLDFENESNIPSVEELFKNYSGINITSPYKKHFLNQVQLTTNAQRVMAINCLKKEKGIIIGENTDYMAIVDILQKLISKYGILEIVILGNGVMANVTEAAIHNLKLNCETYSRKTTDDFTHLNLANKVKMNGVLLVINTCAREYVFKGTLPHNSIFWDFNYQFKPHNYLNETVISYLDGLEMLELQAQYAVSFWSTL